ncbi:ROK family protein [Bifidobacterium dolichotidis]|nr:ROK family protein [Bifidobacterium dolichotidis]
MQSQQYNSAANANPTQRYMIGVDVGGTKIEAVLLDDAAQVLAIARVPARRGADLVVEDIATLARTVGADHWDDVAQVGIGIPGQVDWKTGQVGHVVNLDIVELDLADQVSAQLGGIPVHVENDVNAAAVGAAAVLHEDEEAIAFLNLGTGLAVGLINNGRIMHGASGSAGEIGHIPIDPNRFECPCGQRGCLETVCSGSAVAQLWPTDDGRPPMPDLIARARAGEPAAQRVLAKVKHALGDAVQIVAQAVDPNTIIVGGGMARTGQPLLDAMSEELSARAANCAFLESLQLPARLKLAPADEPTGAIGAALAARV